MVTATATVTDSLEALSVNNHLFKAITASVTDALAMCGIEAECVGASSVPTPGSGSITGLIGVHGDASGFVTVHAGERVALKAVGGLLQESYDQMSAQVIDGVGEITNIIAGGIKARLSKTDWQFSKITVPSVILGDSYEIAYAKGLEFICVCYELNDPKAIILHERLLRVCMSLLKL